MESSKRVIEMLSPPPACLTQEKVNEWEATKESYPSLIVLLRLDDRFYTMGEDALKLHRIAALPVVFWFGRDICHFPQASFDFFVHKLIDAGYLVAILDRATPTENILFT